MPFGKYEESILISTSLFSFQFLLAYLAKVKIPVPLFCTGVACYLWPICSHFFGSVSFFRPNSVSSDNACFLPAYSKLFIFGLQLVACFPVISSFGDSSNWVVFLLSFCCSSLQCDRFCLLLNFNPFQCFLQIFRTCFLLKSQMGYMSLLTDVAPFVLFTFTRARAGLSSSHCQN